MRTDALTRRLIRLRSDEYDRDFLLATDQFQLKIGATHIGHADVQDQAIGLIYIARRQKCFSGRKGLRRKAKLPE